MQVTTSYTSHDLTDFILNATDVEFSWAYVDIYLPDTCETNVAYAAFICQKMFETHEGYAVMYQHDRLFCLMEVGSLSHVAIQKKCQDMIFDKDALISVSTISEKTLEILRGNIDIIKMHAAQGPYDMMVSKRKKREKNVVLIADDDPLITNLMGVAFSSLAEVHICKTGKRALQLYVQHNPDVVFLDIHMPEQSGHDILRDIMLYDSAAHCFMLSADAVKDNVVGTHKRGAKGFIVKPFSRQKIEVAYKSVPTIKQ